jgi:hypothetical protein
MAPVVAGSAVLACAWFIVFGPLGLLFGGIGIIIVPFLAIYTMLFLNVMLGMDFSSEAESKNDLHHLLDRKRTTGFPIRSRRAGVRRFARPADELLASLFRRETGPSS